MTGLVLLGVSARALAEPVAGRRSGVTAVDFFGDRDLEGVVKTYALGRDLGLPATAGGLAEAARRLGAEAVVYSSNLENHPRILDRLAQRCELLGRGGGYICTSAHYIQADTPLENIIAMYTAPREL